MVSAASTPGYPAIRSVAIHHQSLTDDAGRSTHDSSLVVFGADDRRPFGGLLERTNFQNRRVVGIQPRFIDRSPDERVAANALHDAVFASGLLELPLRDNDWSLVPAGHTRFLIDDRTSYIQFADADIPAQGQAVLDAMAAYVSATVDHS